MKRYQLFGWLVALIIILLLVGREQREIRTLQVIATAYNSLPSQTDSTPEVAAWGDSLKPGMKTIAVSRDLLRLGLTRNTQVTISGLPGTYRVLDKMHRRWRERIDIYHGKDRAAALEWGVQPVVITWEVEAD